MVNDGSTDSSAEIMYRYSRDDYRFICYDQDNQGVWAARNRGIDESKGKYLLFLGADDRLAENTLSDLIPMMKKMTLMSSN